jgi:hypothetical protein
MITELPPSVLIGRFRACPAIVVLEPLWVQVAALLPTHHDPHPLGCHRPRIPDRVVFDKLIQILVFGCGTAASPTTPARRPPCAAAGMSGSPRGCPSSYVW